MADIKFGSGSPAEVANRVRTGPGNPGKSLNFKKSFSRSGKSWNSHAGPESPGNLQLDHCINESSKPSNIEM